MTRATLHDIAQAANLSIAAVSKALSGHSGVSPEKREMVLKIADALGYRSRSRRTKALRPLLKIAHVFAPETLFVQSHFYNAVVSGMSEAAQRSGLDLQVHPIPDSHHLPEFLRAHLPIDKNEAILLMGIDPADILNETSVLEHPLILVNGIDREMRASSVLPDYELGGYLATRALLNLGHTAIAHVTHPYRLSLRQRMAGFREALEERKLSFDPNFHIIDLNSKNLQSSVAAETVTKLLEKEALPYTAFFCVSDMVALGVIQALQAKGYRVPEDASVIGFDDLPIASAASPSLSSIHVDRTGLGQMVITSLLAQYEHPEQIVRLNTAVSLILRASVQAR